jgi:hypothetical protein
LGEEGQEHKTKYQAESLAPSPPLGEGWGEGISRLIALLALLAIEITIDQTIKAIDLTTTSKGN